MLTKYSAAEKVASDDGMVSGILDLSYMGVYTVWMNLLGTSCLQFSIVKLTSYR